MRKPEIQSPASGQFGVPRVIRPFFFSHSIPDPVSLLIPPNIVEPGKQERANYNKVDDDQVLVASLVQGLVLIQVDVRSRDATSLDRHL